MAKQNTPSSKYKNFESNVNFRNLFINSPYGIVVCELIRDKENKVIDFIHLDANEATAQQTGFKVEELIGKKASELVDEDMLSLLLDKYGRVIDTGEPDHYEQYFDLYDKTLDVTSYPLDKDRFIINFIDITERKKAEEVSDKIAHEWQTTFNTSPDVIWILDKDQRILRSNNTTRTAFGLTEDEIVGKRCWDIVHGTNEPIDDCPVVRARKSLRRQSMELRINDKWFEVVVDPIIDKDGKFNGAVHTIRNITERKKADDLLQNKQKQLDLIYNSTSEIMALIDIDKDNNYHLSSFNPAYLKAAQFQNPDITGEMLMGISIPELAKLLDWPEGVGDEIITNYTRILKSGKPHSVIEPLPAPDGIMYLDSTYTPIFDDSPSCSNILFVGKDITERFKSQEALKASKRELATLMDNLPGIAYRCLNDREWTMLFISSGCHELTGYEIKDLLHNGKLSYSDIIHPDDREKVWNSIQHAVDNKEAFTVEYRITTNEGKTRWVWEKGEGIYNHSGELTHLEGFINDITEKIYADGRLKETLRELNNAQKLANMGSWGIDLGTNEVFASDQAALIYGFDMDEKITPQMVQEVHLPEYREHLDLALIRLIKGEDEYDEVFKLKNIKTHQIRVVHSIAEYNAETNKINVILLDVTERTRVEEKLREQKEMFELVINSVPTRIFWKDLNSVYLGCNTQFAIAAGEKNVNDIIGKNDFELVWGKDAKRYIDDDKQVMGTGKPKLGYEEDYKDADGNQIWWQTNKMPLEDKAGDIFGVLATAEDITQRKQIENQIRESEEKFRGIFEQSPLAIQMYDLEGTLVNVNQRTLDLFGLEDVKYILGFNLWNDPNLTPEKKRILREGNPIFISTSFNFDFTGSPIQFPTSRTGIIHLDMYILPLRQRGEIIGYLVQVVEVTKQKQAEEELLAQMNDLKRYNKAMVGRENRMIELKKQVNELSRRCGLDPPYPLEFENKTDNPTDENSKQ